MYLLKTLPLALTLGLGLSAEPTANLSGHWTGAFRAPNQQFPFVFDLRVTESGTAATLGDGNKVFPAKVKIDGQRIEFFAREDQRFFGKLDADGTISGTHSIQGYALPFELSRDGDAIFTEAPANASLAQGLAGDWEGQLQVGAKTMRLKLHLGAQAYAISVDEGNLEIPIVIQQGAVDGVKLSAPAVDAVFQGTLSNPHELTGVWSQGTLALAIKLNKPAGE